MMLPLTTTLKRTVALWAQTMCACSFFACRLASLACVFLCLGWLPHTYVSLFRCRLH